MIVYVATANLHKLEEIRAALPAIDWRLPAQAGITDFEVEETGSSFAANAWLKAEALWLRLGQPVLADDSGLCVDALGGRPGIHSARYGSIDGVDLDSAGRNRLLLAEMEGKTQRSCRFVCCMSLVLGPQRFFTVQETCEGQVLDAPRGEAGFGYDPIVYLPELGCSLAELDGKSKNRVSHRGKALGALARLLGP